VMGKAGPGAVEADAGMDAVQRRLMFEDEWVASVPLIPSISLVALVWSTCAARWCFFLLLACLHARCFLLSIIRDKASNRKLFLSSIGWSLTDSGCDRGWETVVQSNRSFDFVCRDVCQLTEIPNFHRRCILVDEQDNVVGHESKYNCTWQRVNPSIPFNYVWLRFSKHDFDIGAGYCFLMVLCWYKYPNFHVWLGLVLISSAGTICFLLLSHVYIWLKPELYWFLLWL
jgi:hypothetical protein